MYGRQGLVNDLIAWLSLIVITPLNIYQESVNNSQYTIYIRNQSKWISLAVYPILRDQIPYFLQPTCVISFLVFQARSHCVKLFGAVAFHNRIPNDSHVPIHSSLTRRQMTETTREDWSWKFDFPHAGKGVSGSLWECSTQRHFRRASSFPSCWKKSCHASAYF